ncbi:receptor-type tyrosine-protein kinase FLT3 isoform X2 [Antennarius striatus]|uniref:receptor-type tyrosine-protein kinase FLT3 isoform X2 n=1 Tax=Antennarius striatus TaxID=241820 RepID=UPI0035B249D1
MIAAVVLLCAFKFHFSGGAVANNPPCVSSHEVECIDIIDLRAAGPEGVEVCVGKKLNISLEHGLDYLICHWSKGADLILTISESRSMVLPPLSETDSGKYNLSCETKNETRTSLTVFLHVVMKRPIKPLLTLDRVNEKRISPYFTCTSEGCPEPTLEWFGSTELMDDSAKRGKAKITTSSTKFPSGMMCCATNAEGQECSQLYDYDLEQNFITNDEVTNMTVSPGQPLLLRCRKKYNQYSLVWENGPKVLDASTLNCPSKVNEDLCIKNDSHDGSSMAYLFFKSIRAYHSGIYTCRSPENKMKSVYIHVQASEGFLSVQLDKNKTISALKASTSCLQASVSYHPVLQKCSWEAPDKTLTKCIREMQVTKHRTVKLCDPLRTGDYKLHLEAGGKKDTKTISVCVVDTPKFKFSSSDAKNTFTFETVSLVPANYTWLSCAISNDSCEAESSWKVIPDACQGDSDVLCEKNIQSSLSRDLVVGHHLRFCLTNSVGSWCQTRYSINNSSGLNYKPVPASNISLTVLQVGSLILILGLSLIAIVLVYFIRNKKRRYEPQLQMIQMVGPNDNDYIYINFKDFEYDLKWEFPRENLKLGKELGSGAFGMVVQATAYGISKPGVSQQVAVKMLKEKHHVVEKEALMSELKMLTHIGHHTNIVNLLGACTETAPTYLIFQYCCYGDLLNYLKLNRERYNNSTTDMSKKDGWRGLYHNLKPRRNSSEQETVVDNYVPMHSSTTRGQHDTTLLIPNDCFDEICDNLDDEDEGLQALTFDDLLSFAFQVAKGMDFLSSKNCIHRDLAARNVLMTKGRLVKIGDFGLARDIDNDSNYVVKGNARLPVKWMAPESIFQGIYTMKSDVWAYGILLWEIFSLGVTPYPAMEVDHKFYSLIKKGFKMECPPYANESVYGTMCRCWTLDAHNRPPFSKLLSCMCDQLTDKKEEFYLYMRDQTASDYHNASAILDTSALTKQSEGKTQLANDYCQTYTTEKSEVDKSQSEVMGVEEKLLKPADAK